MSWWGRVFSSLPVTEQTPTPDACLIAETEGCVRGRRSLRKARTPPRDPKSKALHPEP